MKTIKLEAIMQSEIEVVSIRRFFRKRVTLRADDGSYVTLRPGDTLRSDLKGDFNRCQSR